MSEVDRVDYRNDHFINYPIEHPGITEQFYEQGYAVAKGVLSKDVAEDLRKKIEFEIEVCAKQLGCLKEEYVFSASRWAHPSPITSCVSSRTVEKLSSVAQTLIKRPVQFKKMNVICKIPHSSGVPYHQDISYSPQDPYEFSIWVALNDLSEKSAPLEVIPASHYLPLKPAVDFWSPNYRSDSSLKCRAKKNILNAGDAVFFDSRLWHGSAQNTDLFSRYALVTRWCSEGWKLDQPIPPVEPDFFGLWTSGEITQKLLAQGLEILFNRSEADFVKIIDSWMQYLQENPTALPFVCDTRGSLEFFKRLKILHFAHTFHNGGDATGTVYKGIWEKFLSSLKEYLSQVQKTGTDDDPIKSLVSKASF
jgi:ectoine hydroxylase-related dioxygenase (phytanoyl-CoA dioxygenase family)